MRLFATLVFLNTCCFACFGPSAKHLATPDLQFSVSDYGKHFSYSISNPESVREAWIEVLDRPLIVAKKSIPAEPNGTLDWDWDRSALNYYEQPEDKLVLSIWDPHGASLICDINTVMTLHGGGVVTDATVGGRERFAPQPRLGSSWTRTTQGAKEITLEVLGADLGPNTEFHVQTSRGSRCDNRSVHAQVLNLAHARITLDADCLQEAGLVLVTAGDDAEHGATVHVAGRTSPILSSVSPATLSNDMRLDQVRLILRGRGFTKASTAYAGHNPESGNYYTDQLYLQTEYVSPTALRAHVDLANSPDHGGTVDLPAKDNLRIWVKGNNDEKSELSEARDVIILRRRSRPSARPTLIDLKHGPPTAVITTVSPFPIQPMDEHGPKELKVTIRGEHFVAGDKVQFAFGGQSTNNREVRTEYVSPTTLHAWLPRQLWRKHALSYRLVVKTTAGRRYTRQVNEEDDK